MMSKNLAQFIGDVETAAPIKSRSHFKTLYAKEGKLLKNLEGRKVDPDLQRAIFQNILLLHDYLLHIYYLHTTGWTGQKYHNIVGPPCKYYLHNNNLQFFFAIKFKYSEQATKFDEISILVLMLLSNVKTKMEISSNFCGLLRNPTILPLFRKFRQITRNRAGGTRWVITPHILADLDTKPVLSNDLLHISVFPPPPDVQIFRRL